MNGATNLKLLRPEGVAGLHVAGLEADFEPLHALRRGAMCKALGNHMALRLLLDHVVADLAGGVEAFLDVAGLQAVLELVIEVRPHAGKAIRLQLHPHLDLIGVARISLLHLLHLVGDAENGLHVMANLVGDDVGLREVARRAEAALQLLIEGEVEVAPLVRTDFPLR